VAYVLARETILHAKEKFVYYQAFYRKISETLPWSRKLLKMHNFKYLLSRDLLRIY
jgi:hypothetical protein